MSRERAVRLKDIAAEAKLSVQAVSMALRGHTRIAESTRRRVRAIADRLGYQPDPAMAALSRYRTETRRAAHKWENVALVSSWEEPQWAKFAHYQRLHNALKQEAAARGIALEDHWLGPHGATATGVFRRIFHKGIRGVIVAPMPVTDKPEVITFPAQKFQVVTFGPEHYYPDYHVIQPDFYENLRLTWGRLQAMGCRRIGLVYGESFNWRTSDAWLGAYLAEKRLAGFSPTDLQPLMTPNIPTLTEFRDWLEETRADAVITIFEEIRRYMTALGRTEPVANLSVHGSTGMMGIDVDPESAANAAFEVLMMEMQRTLKAESGLPLRIHIPGKWAPGA